MPLMNAASFFWPTLCMSALLLGGGVGFQVTQMLKPTTVVYNVSGNGLLPDVDAAMAKYESAKASGKKFSKALSVDEMINVSYRLFENESQTWTQGVGSSFAAGLVNQGIFSTTVHDGDRFFEESISASSFVKLYDRMFQSGDKTITYWGDDTHYESHPEKEYDNETYKEIMGRYVSSALIFVVSPRSLLTNENLSGERSTGIYEEEDGYVIEAELSPIYGTFNYKKQMQTSSNLKYQPTFDYCHWTVWTDANLNLRKMKTAERYVAVTSAGVGSSAIGSLTTIYHHEAAPFGFPEVGSKLPDYPESL